MFEQQTGYLITALGLCCDVVGAVLLFKFGLPEIVRTGGVQLISIETIDKAVLQKERCFDIWGKIGLAMLILGFIGQLIPTINSYLGFK